MCYFWFETLLEKSRRRRILHDSHTGKVLLLAQYIEGSKFYCKDGVEGWGGGGEDEQEGLVVHT